MTTKLIKVSCVIGGLAFLFHAAIASFSNTAGGGRFVVSLIYIGYAISLFSFLRRQNWSWLFVFIVTPSNILAAIFIPPTEYFYSALIFIAKNLVFIESLFCAAIFVTMFFPATKAWFTGSTVIENINKEEFHEGEVIEATYRNNFWDIIWFNFYQTPRNRGAQISFIGTMLLIAFLTFSALSGTEYSFSTKVLAYFLFLVIIFLGMIFLSFIVIGFIYMIRQFDIRTIQDCKLSVSESGVVSETPFKNKGIKWSDVKKIQQNSKYLIIFLSDRAALLIPKRNLNGKVDAQKLFDYSEQCLVKSKNLTLFK